MRIRDEKIRIRDGKKGSGTNIPDPQHWNNFKRMSHEMGFLRKAFTILSPKGSW